jgi:hypothetical protein
MARIGSEHDVGASLGTPEMDYLLIGSTREAARDTQLVRVVLESGNIGANLAA